MVYRSCNNSIAFSPRGTRAQRDSLTVSAKQYVYNEVELCVRRAGGGGQREHVSLGSSKAPYVFPLHQIEEEVI